MLTLLELPSSLDALVPVISARTLGFHYGKHLCGYMDNLNKLLPGSPFEGMPLEEIVCKASGAIFNNAGQVLNHNLYFEQFTTPQSNAAPQGALAAQISKQWGSFEAFQSAFVVAGASLFGSGWVWLSAAQDGSLVITQEPGANNPVSKGRTPLLTFDVWEHAYYLDYQNRRADHLKALWSIVNWDVIEKRYGK